MDSMRSLNTSLPRPPRRPNSIYPSEDLVQFFKNAALSVTNLYRTAEASEQRGRQHGYQDALDELLAFLDKENIGLCDGEGWQVRQWATERLNDQPANQAGSESDDEKAETVRQTRSTSPSNHQRPMGPLSDPPDQRSSSSPGSTLSSTLDQQPHRVHETPSLPTSDVFTFRSAYQVPQDTNIHPPDVANIDLLGTDIIGQTRPTSAVTVNVIPRNPKSSRTIRNTARATTARSLGNGAGTKRRVPFGDYFDLASLEGVKRGKLG